MNVETAPVAADLWTKPIDLSQELACRLPVNYIQHRQLSLLSPKADTHFIIQRRVKAESTQAKRAKKLTYWLLSHMPK